MAYPSELARVNLIWAPKAAAWPGEQAVCGFWVQHQHFVGNGFGWDSELQYLADNVQQKLVDHWGDLAGQFGSGYYVSQIKAVQMGTDGTEIDAKTSAVDPETLVGTAANILPPEVALCLSFYGYVPGQFTAHAGRKRGRMYLPYLSAVMSNGSGRLANAASYLSHWQDLFNDIQGMHIHEGPSPAGNSSDYWRVGVASKTDGTFSQVERIAFDDKFDSQRRRQHQSPGVTELATISHD